MIKNLKKFITKKKNKKPKKKFFLLNNKKKNDNIILTINNNKVPKSIIYIIPNPLSKIRKSKKQISNVSG